MTDTDYSELESSIWGGDQEAGTSIALQLVDNGVDPLNIYLECIEPVLANVGEKFERLEIFLPEMIESANVVKNIHQALKPHLQAKGEITSKGKIVICTITGDLHDIGKNIVRAMLEVNGFEVKDLGVDVDPSDVVNGAKEFDADIIAVSALMLPSLPFVSDVIEYVREIKDYQERFKILVGGGPVTQEWADSHGADGYGDNAIEAVRIAGNLLT
jgi:5-methyltetrahydrofolate--homocysteine methyltransferase